MKVMLFGDSHLAALKSGLSLVQPPDGVKVLFWGTPGNRFRNISWKDKKIVPDDEKTANAFARFNGEGVRELDPSCYDAVVFVGARIRPGAVVPDLLNHIADPERYLTRGYIREVLSEHYAQHTTYQAARSIAALGVTAVMMNMISFETVGQRPTPRSYRVAGGATRRDIGLLWDLTRDILEEDGITFIPQPFESIVNGFYTDARFGLDRDPVHKNADYGALILSEIFGALARGGACPRTTL